METSPSADHTPIFLEVLGSALTTEVPNKRLTLDRLTLAPGASMFAHTHPGQLVVADRVRDAGLHRPEWRRGVGACREPGPRSPRRSIPPGTEVFFGPGEFLVEPPGVAHTYRNPGDEPVVLLMSGLVGFDVFFQPVETDIATPAA